MALPAETLRQAGLKAGDEVAIEVDGPGRIVVRRAAPREVATALGVFDGLYQPDHLERSRSAERA